MPDLYLLGTGAAVSDPHRTTTMLAFHDADTILLVDCGGDVLQRLMLAGLDVDAIEALIVTHEHPDHVSGFPLLIEKLWLCGRRRPLPVYGPVAATRQARKLWEAFETGGWKEVPDIQWHDIPLEEHTDVLENDVFRVTASPNEHGIPCIGIRVESKTSGKTVAYSCDTAPSDKIVRLAKGADLLVHEAGGDHPAHSTEVQASEIAAKAGAGRPARPPSARRRRGRTDGSPRRFRARGLRRRRRTVRMLKKNAPPSVWMGGAFSIPEGLANVIGNADPG